MEKIEKINEFVSVFTGYGYGYGSGYGSSSGYGYGDGYGDGYGYGFGSGYGSGYGSGTGNGNGYGYGSGNGSGYGYDDGSGYGDGSGDGDGDNDGYGIKSFCGMPVMVIDNVATIILQVRGNIAKGIILNGDLTTTPCYIVKQNNMFAHGNTLHEARESLLTKLFEDMSEEERIAEFIKEHKPDTLYPATDFFEWHGRLTGSCLMGRESFCKDNGINLKSEMTVAEFINYTLDAYGGWIIREVKKQYMEAMCYYRAEMEGTE